MIDDYWLDKAAVVTGGARGQGASIAKMLVRAGAHVYVMDYLPASDTAWQQLQEFSKSQPGTLTFVPAHVAVRAKVKPSAALVRGTDRWHHFQDEPRPQVEFGEKEREFQQYANSLFRAIYDEERPRYQRTNA